MSLRLGTCAAALLAGGLASWGCRSAAPRADPAAPALVAVELTIDYGSPERAPLRHRVQVPPGSSVLAATQAVAEVRQAWVCCSEEDVFGIDGLDSDAARDGYWTWWLDGELGGGFAHQVFLRGGEALAWRFRRGDPEGRGAEPTTRIAALAAEACAALEEFGAGRNLVAHGEDCELLAHAALPRFPVEADSALLASLEPAWVIATTPRAVPAGARLLVFGPAARRPDWEALGELSGRRGAALVAWTARDLQATP